MPTPCQEIQSLGNCSRANKRSLGLNRENIMDEPFVAGILAVFLLLAIPTDQSLGSKSAHRSSRQAAKEGRCPSWAVIRNCRGAEQCERDRDCPGTQKCCRNACETRSCIEAITGLEEESCPKDDTAIKSHKNNSNCLPGRTSFGFKGNCRKWCYHSATCNPHPGLLVSKEECIEVLCASVTCRYPGEVCSLDKYNNPRCACRTRCPVPLPEEAVCGTDGIPYKSTCEMNKTACILGEKHIKIHNIGKCRPNGVKVKVSAAHKFSQVLPLYKEGEITCRFVGDPVIITWEKVGLGSLPNRMVPRRNKLDIAEVDMRDSGMYKCKAYDGFFTAEAEINVTVNGPEPGPGEPGVDPMPRAVCLKAPSAGYCKQHIVRWHFSSKGGLCRPFAYSGCGGNENNFGTREECSSACGHAAGDICNLPAVEGPCKGFIPQWFYNTKTERCEQFVYGGCSGNANMFESKRGCEIRCMEGSSLSTPCLRQEREARINKQLGIFVPKCRPDGGYDERQCHGSICFCMDEEGEEISGSRVHRQSPLNCSGILQPPPEEGLTPCQQARQNTSGVPFGGSYLVRCKQDGTYEEVQCSGSTGFCWCVDKHGAELKGTKTRGPIKCPVLGIRLTLCQQQYIEQLRSPRPDQEISRCRHDGSFEEVQCRGMLCFCVDSGSGRMVGNTIINTLFGEPRCSETGRGLTVCQRLHQEALSNHQNNIYVPQCKLDGSFEEVQCHGPGNECWCVDEQGNEMNGTKTTGALRCPSLGKPLTSCQKEYQKFLKHWWHSFSRFVPRCAPDGSYAEVQCTGGVCYCVTPTGKEITGTRIFNSARQPNCTHQEANAKPCENKRQKAVFHSKQFVPLCKPDGSWSEIQCQRTSGLCWCVDSDGNEVPGTRSARLEKCPNFDQLSPCRKRLVNLLKNPHPDKHLPWCRADGSYNPMQCYGSYCYCVNEDGDQRPGTKTSVAVGRPICTYTSGIVTSCQKKYREAPLRYFQGVMVPRCKLDGQYEEVQCQGSTGECWCVDLDGKQLPGTRTPQPIKCPVLGSHLTRCQQHYMEYAKSPLPGQMIPRCRGDGAFESVQCKGLSCFCVDENGSQIEGTSLPVRLGKPKCVPSDKEPLTTCQEQHKRALFLPATPSRFIPTCKRDGGFEEVQCQSSTDECWCVKESGNEILGTRTTGYIKCPSSVVSLTPCQTEYQETLRSWLLPGPYIPQCTHEGKYNPIQCQGSYCFCVNEHGVELVGTRMDKSEGKPDCSDGGYTLTLCQKRFQDYLRHPMPGRFEPRCDKTGAFKEVQCQGPSCFCVNREGIEVQGTRSGLSMGKPVCFKPGIALTQCQKQLQEAISSAPVAGKFVPRCKFDGSYEEIQCQNATGLCWCVDQHGKELAFTATNKTAQCPKTDSNSLCWTRYQQNVRSSALGSRVPRCRSDGSFSPLQIQASQFFCVNDRGDEVPGTSVDVSLGKPDCGAARSHGYIVTPCQRERARRLYLPLMAGKYVPRCRVDGKYDEVQCDVTIGQCWCVDSDGREMRGSRTEGVIRCPAEDELSPCQKQQMKAKQLSSIGLNTWFFIPRCREDGGYHEVQCHVSTGQCWCVDENGNERWGTAVRGLPDCSGNMTSCQRHRTRALGLTGHPPPGRYVPSCKPDGAYNEVQCHGFTGLCWCVNSKGNEILGTRKWGRPKCEKIPLDHETPVDLGILIDSSDGITEKNWRRILEFASSVVDSFDVTPRGSHVGVVVFGRDAEIPLYFNTLQENNLTSSNVKDVIRNLRHRKGSARLDLAMLLADEELFNEGTGMRSEIPKALLLVTASSQTRNKGPYTPLLAAAQGLKDKGVSVYTIGIGDKVPVAELMDIASDYRNVFTVDGFSTLRSRGIIVTDIIKNETNDMSMELLCNLAPEPGQVGCLASMSAFYFDAASGECLPFIYSGCGGNANNFPSYGLCMKKCKGVLPSCLAEQKQVSTWRVGHFVPRCKPSGRYEDIQCYEQTGYCWCVDEYGNESPGTHVQGIPICSMAAAFGKTTPCLEERRKALGWAGVPSLGRFVPECKPDGEYEEVQCFGNTKFCWCSDKHGYEVAGTHQWGRPQCPVLVRPGLCPMVSDSSKCPAGMSQQTCAHDKDCPASSKCCECGCTRRCTIMTSNKQVSACVRENVKSSACPYRRVSGRLYPKCKPDGDRGYEEVQCDEPSGACWCVDEDGNETPGSREIGTPNCTIQAALTECQREYHRAMVMRSRSRIGLFVTSCRPDGSFESIQCHDVTGYCWCVDKNGNELAGTRQWGKPNCTATGKTMTACQMRHEECLENAPPGHFVPRCKTDGSYLERQCLQSVGECWCVDRNGNELPGTRSKEKQDCTLLAWLSPCQIQRRRALGLRGVPVVGVFVPECKADGTYDAIQCHVTSGYCWCVDEYGNESPGSRIRGRPNCDDKRPCEKENQQILASFPEPPPGMFVPQCRVGGKYQTTQCHGSTGYCWCVDRYGNELSETKVRGDLNCSVITDRLPLCQNNYNQASKVNERGHYVPLCKPDGAFEQLQCNSATGECWCVGKGGREKPETRRVGKPDCDTTGKIKNCQLSPDPGPCKAYMPAWFFNKTAGACAVFVYGGCGGNSNRFVNYDDCQANCNGKNLTFCEMQREINTGRSEQLIPRCKKDGSFEHAQCHRTSGECWCVDEFGMETPGSRTRDPPECGEFETEGHLGNKRRS